MVFRRSKEAKFKIQPDDPVDPSIEFTVSGWIVCIAGEFYPCPFYRSTTRASPRCTQTGLAQTMAREGLGLEWGCGGGLSILSTSADVPRGKSELKKQQFPTPFKVSN